MTTPNLDANYAGMTEVSILASTGLVAARGQAAAHASPPASESSALVNTHRMLIESIPHMVWMTDAAGATIYFNPKATEFLGVPAKQVCGYGWLDFLHPDDIEAASHAWGEAVRTGKPYAIEYRVRGPQGDYRWYLSQAMPHRDAHGRIECWVGTWTDIDYAKRVAEDLRRTASLLTAVADNSPDAIFVKDLQGRYLLFNKAAEQFVGKSAEEVLGRDDRALFPPDQAQRVMDADRRVVETGQSETQEERLTAAGVTRVYSAMKAPLRDKEGKIVGTIGISREITAAHEAAEQLRMRDRAMQAVTQGILITDPRQPDNPIVYASPSFEALTGYRAEEVLGRNCRILQGPETDLQALACIREAIANGRPCVQEILNYRRDGSTFWNELSLSPVFDEAGELTHFVGVQADITVRKRLEAQLMQAQKMEAIGQLAGGVAHDFNNMLTIVTGYTNLLLETLPADADSREYLLEIRTAAERSAALTHQLLAFSRKQLLTLRVFDVNDAVRDTQKMLKRLIGEDIELATSLHPALYKVRADSAQLQQALVNLVVNARDAMPEGGRLTIETDNVTLDETYCESNPGVAPGEYVLLAVSDTGCGMTDEVRRRIFEPFFTTKSLGQGTGLGLPVVHGFVKQSEGHIAVYTELGIGTTFKIYLPRAVSGQAQDAPRDGQSPIAGGQELVLLVEDEPVVRTLATKVLRNYGYRVLTAENPDAALQIAAEHGDAIQILVTDVVMPGMGGRYLAERLSKMMPDLKVLYLSGYTNDAVVRHGVLHDQVNFLQKPFAPAALARKVRQVLDR